MEGRERFGSGEGSDRVNALDMVDQNCDLTIFIVRRKERYPYAVLSPFYPFDYTYFYDQLAITIETDSQLAVSRSALQQAGVDALLVADYPKMYLHRSHGCSVFNQGI